MKLIIKLSFFLVFFAMAVSCTAATIDVPEKYNLDNDLEAVNRISTFRIKSYENIDQQSLVLEANYNDYYLLVLRRPRFEITFGKTGIPHMGSAIIAGHDRVVMNYNTGPEYYYIDKIYKLDGRKQVTEIKKMLREE